MGLRREDALSLAFMASRRAHNVSTARVAETRAPDISRNSGATDSYFAGSALKVATRGALDTVWGVTEVDPGTDSRLRRVDIARSLDALHVVYETGDADAPQLRHATRDGASGWSTETIADSPAHDPRIAIDQGFDAPVLLYKNATALRHARRLSTTWSFTTVFDHGEQVSHYALISNGIVSIDVMFVVAGADHDEVEYATSSQLPFPAPDGKLVDRVSQFVVADIGRDVLAQLSPRTGGGSSVSAKGLQDGVAQRVQDGGDIIGATQSLRSTKHVILRATGQPLRLLGTTGRVLPSGNTDCLHTR